MIHCCEAPKSMLSNYFCKNQVLRGTFGEIWRIQIQIYPKTYVELKSPLFQLVLTIHCRGADRRRAVPCFRIQPVQGSFSGYSAAQLQWRIYRQYRRHHQYSHLGSHWVCRRNHRWHPGQYFSAKGRHRKGPGGEEQGSRLRGEGQNKAVLQRDGLLLCQRYQLSADHGICHR